MGFQTSWNSTNKMQEVKCHDSSLKPSQFMVVETPRHKRSKSDSCQKVKEDGSIMIDEASNRFKLDAKELNDPTETKKKQSPKSELSLKQEILQLEKRLNDQFAERRALEKALGYKSFSHDSSNETSVPKPAKELIKEIAVLEYEVVHLEQYLLSLYRKAYDDQQGPTLSPSTDDDRSRSPSITQKKILLEVSGLEITPKKENAELQCNQVFPHNSFADSQNEHSTPEVKEKVLDSCVYRSRSSLSQLSACSPPMESLGKTVRTCHSQPLSYVEHVQSSTTNVISLAEHLGTRISDHILETPNKFSEDMIKCISAIYCKLADPPLTGEGPSFSPISSLSSISFSPQDQCDMWSPRYRKDSSFDARLDNPFNVEGLKEFSGPYSTMVEVPCIYRDNQRLTEVDDLLQTYRSLVCRLEEIDPRKMKHEEKIAFWINIHNALVMHAFLAYGIPQNNLKRVSLLLKAAYNVGGQTISADMIQTSILGCRMPRPGQWLWILFSPKTKLKAGDNRQAYAIGHTEPLLHFALCSGSHSDPAIRVYTPKRVVMELEAAKEEYIRANFGIRKKQKILLPKLLESFAKDSGLCPVGVVEMIQKGMPETLRKSMQRYLKGRNQKNIEWLPHNFAFRYLISKELIK
ncbi:hypothetical protein IFM89_015741 [Coptis chinensis]|uniref:Electron transporter n=1 Tax=Coptis chinensis TaxID=261450 RepID=A0A835LVU7_9MAGN|nr:hypothetical protein IFM89_015741 [Coptis chinensis]